MTFPRSPGRPPPKGTQCRTGSWNKASGLKPSRPTWRVRRLQTRWLDGLLDALDASGRAGNTIVVLMSDHGFHLGEKHRWRKNSLWNEATHVPLIIVAPGVTVPGSRSGKPVSLLDVYPTLTELAGVPVPDHLEGTSLLPLIEDPDAEWDHVAITTEGFGNHSVRGERYRYTRYADGSEEVYDLEADPNEWTNLADDPAMAGVKQRLSARLPEVNVRLQR